MVAKEVKLMALQRGIRIHHYLLPRQLAGESLYPQHLSPAYTDFNNPLSRTRVAGEQGKVRTGSKTSFQLCRLPVRPERGQGQTHNRTLAGLDRQYTVNTIWSGMPGLAVHVPHRSTHSNRKTSPPRATLHEAHTVALEEQLEGTRVTRKGDPGPQLHPYLRWWLEESNVLVGQPLHPVKTCSANIYRRIKRRVGRSLRQAYCKGNLVPSRKQVAQAIQTWPDHSNRVVTSSRSVPSCMLPVASTSSRPVCHQVQQQTATVCITGPRPPGMGSGCTQPFLGGPGPIRFSTSSHLGQSGGKVTGLPLQQDNTDCPSVAQHALFLGSSGNVQTRSCNRALLMATESHSSPGQFPQRQTQGQEGHPLLEPFPGATPVDKGSL